MATALKTTARNARQASNVAVAAPKTKAQAKAADVATMDNTQLGSIILAAAGLRANGTSLRSPKLSKDERQLALSSSARHLMEVSLGQKRGGAGPLAKRVMIVMMAQKLTALTGKTVKVVQKPQVTADLVLGILSDKAFVEKAKATLDQLVKSLPAIVGDDKDKVKARKAERDKNRMLAMDWLTSGRWQVYRAAVENCKDLTNVTYDKVCMPVNRALGVGFGKPITASECAGVETVTVA